MSAGYKVALITVAMVVISVATAIRGEQGVLSGRVALFDDSLRWWQLALIFFIAEVAVAHIEISKEAVTISLSESILLVGLVTLSPMGLIAARAVGGLAAMLWRRPTMQKAMFNIALFACEAAIAAMLFDGVFRVTSYGAPYWLSAGLSVLIAAILSVAAVNVVISFYDADRPRGLLMSALVVQGAIAVPSISLAIIGISALVQSSTNLLYICALFTGIVLLLKRITATTQRASEMESIGHFTALLVGLTGTDEVAETALREIARTLRGYRAAIVFHPTSPLRSQMYCLESDDVRPNVDYDFWPLVDGLDKPGFIESVERDGTIIIPDAVAAPIAVNSRPGMIVVWDRSTDVGEFLARDPRTLGSMVDQVNVALGRAGLIDQLHYDANHDALTQLPNRSGFALQLDACAELTGALYLLDLDRFKDINDTLGHPTGDSVLQIIARRLHEAVGHRSMLARLGGDEFAIFDQATTDVASASEFAAHLVTVIEAAVQIEGLSLHIGASIGVALAPDHGDALTALMSHADTAMYEAKEHQCGWQFYHLENDINDPRRLELVTELRKAIDNRTLEVWYQPRVCLKTRRVVGAEALARWNHDRFGFVSPDEFIGLAEAAGLMRDLTDAILERTISDIRHWDNYGIELPIAVNLSTRNLLDDTLSSRVNEMLIKSNIPCDRLSFEITETAIMINRERVTELLGEFHDLEISLAIDDFGTGYSSLAYLRDLPVDELKIDRSFITDVDIDPQNEVIVRSTIDMAHNLGLVVVAEGIEREEEYALLAALGCDYAQGYLMSKALPADEFEIWLGANGHPALARPLRELGEFCL